MSGSSKIISHEELSKHAENTDCWISVHGVVMNITPFLNEHPGGPDVIVAASGRDCSREFEDVGHTDSSRRISQNYIIGRLQGVDDLPNPLRIPTNKEVHDRKDSQSQNGSFMTLVSLSAVFVGIIAAYYSYVAHRID